MEPEYKHLAPENNLHDQTDYESTQMGLIAQEAQDVIPEVLMEDNKGALSLNYGNMAGIFVEAIKELNEKVDKQQKEIEELKKGLQ